MFFWYFPALEPQVENPPLIVWLQGGPGSSSSIGLFTEMGPLLVTPEGTLKRNPNTWAKHSSMIFIDNPLGTGFSFVGKKGSKKTHQSISESMESHLPQVLLLNNTTKCSPPPLEHEPKFEDGYVCNQAAVSVDLINFLDSFYAIFPKTLNSKLYLAGESYAGKYVPALSYYIDEINEKRDREGSIIPRIPLAGLAVGNGLTDPISQILTHSPQALALGLIGEADAKRMDLFAKTAVNYICKEDYKSALAARESLFKVFSEASGGVNFYDVRKGNNQYNRTAMIKLLNNPAVKESLNVGTEAIYGKDWDMFPKLEEDIMKSSAAYLPKLLDRGYKVLLYQGQFDIRDGTMSQNKWISEIDWKHHANYQNASRVSWMVNGNIAGYSTSFKNLVRVEVSGCGHLCPGDVTTTDTMIKEFLHGSTMLTAEDRFAGSTDVLLGEEGHRQAMLLAERLSSINIGAFYSSNMLRTLKTAALIASAHKLEVQPIPELREVSHGVWEGKTKDEVLSEHAEQYAAYESDPFTQAPPDGESGLNVLSRALPAFQKIVEAHPGETILIVSHKATIRILVSYFLGFDLRRYRDVLDQQPCCLNVLDFNTSPISARLILFNDITHYETNSESRKEIGKRLSRFYG